MATPSYLLTAVSLLGLVAAIPSPAATSSSIPPIYLISDAQWQRLNGSVGGRLARGTPLAKPCYSLYNGSVVTPDLLQCANVQNNFTSDLFITQYYGGFVTPNWAFCQASGQSCSLDEILPSNPTAYAPPMNCYQGSVSPYYIAVQSVSDIQAGLAFAKANNIPLTIKNSGHDYKGRASAPNSLALWTHTLMAGPTLQRNFVPDGCSRGIGPGVTFGAGQNFQNLYLFADANNLTIAGGSSHTVGVGGGWILGGGHSSLSNVFGLGVDQVMQIRGVLPNGTYVTANQCQNPDLWFAWRGGGGSTFGVNYEMTLRAYPRVRLQVAYFRMVSLVPTAYRQFITICVNNAAKWASEGWGGYIEPAAKSQDASGFILTTPLLSLDQATKSMQPMLDFAATQISLNASVKTSDSFYNYYSNYIEVPGNADNADVSLALGSRLIPNSQFSTAGNRSQLIDTLINMADQLTFPAAVFDPRTFQYGDPLRILVVTPNNYPVSAATDTSSVTPAWRSATWHVQGTQFFSNQADALTISGAFSRMRGAVDMLRALPLTSGAYQNEDDPFESDPATTFWGQKNYKRLLAIKQKLDPGNLLTCHQCIGWNASDSRYNCYPQY